jgi:hypothetical protein
MKTLLASLLLLWSAPAFTQVAINTDGTSPDNSSLLDVKSDSKGVLLPRMPYWAIQAIPNPATGLLVYQTDILNGFYYNAGTPENPDWKPVGHNATDATAITDADGDTFITTDEGPDGDIIRFYSRNLQTMWLDSTRLVISSGNFNMFIGDSCGAKQAVGSGNLYIGPMAGARSTSGTQNMFLGPMAGRSNQGGNNMFIGAYSGLNNSSGWNNTFLGVQSGYMNTVGFRNTFIGIGSGYNNTEGENNTFLGRASGYYNQVGSRNVYLGNESGVNNLSGEKNVFIGNQAGANETGSFKLYISNSDTSNPLIYGAFDEGILKFQAQRIEINNPGGNTFIGSKAGKQNDWGNMNVFVGDSTGEANIEGEQNAFFGAKSGKKNTGSGNVFIGSNSGENNTTGAKNTFVGLYAGNQTTTGFRNTYVGLSSGYYNTTGDYNTFVGRCAGFSNIEGSGNVFIGNMAGFNETGSNMLYIANSELVPPLIYGEFDNSLVKVHGQVNVVDHDIYINNPAKGIILTSPNGQCWRVTVGDDGSLATMAIPCP